MSIFYKTSTTLLLTLLTIFSVSAQSSGQTSGKVQPSTIITDIIKKKKQTPKISDQSLADYANEMLAKQGFNYNFDMSELFFQISPRKEYPENMKEVEINFPFEFTLVDNRKKNFNLTAKHNLMNQCYDESSPAFPLTQATAKLATVIAEGKPLSIKLPKEFSGTSVSMVDNKTKKKALQTWLLPYRYGISEENLVGISADGKKLYLTIEDSYLINENNPLFVKELALEVSADGKLRFVPKSGVKQKLKVKYLSSEMNFELGELLMKVSVGSKTYYFAVPDMSC